MDKKKLCKLIIDGQGNIMIADSEGKVIEGQTSCIVSQNLKDSESAIARVTLELLVSTK